MSKELNDSLDDLLGGPTGQVRTEPVRESAPALVSAEQRWVEGCPKCRGSGQTPWGVCFRCRGAGGKTFKTSPEARAKGRARAVVKRTNREAEKFAWREEHKAELAWLAATAQRQQENSRSGRLVWDFPAKLQEALMQWGTLTDGQLAAVQKCMARDAQRTQERAKAAQERAQAAPTVDVSKLEAAFQVAREKAERAGQMGVWIKPISLHSGDKATGVTVKFSPGSIGSKWEGMIFAKNGEGKKLGFVKDGKFQRNFVCEDAEAAAVLDCASDPAKAAVAFGKAWSVCGICHKTLTNDGSIERGIGPICAARFGW